MREHLVGPSCEASSWPNRDAALVSAASYPDGRQEVLECRERIVRLMPASSWHKSCTGAAATLRHMEVKDDKVSAGEIYVGPGSPVYPPSPWLDPTSMQEEASLDYETYVRSRSDLVYLTQP